MAQRRLGNGLRTQIRRDADTSKFPVNLPAQVLNDSDYSSTLWMGASSMLGARTISFSILLLLFGCTIGEGNAFLTAGITPVTDGSVFDRVFGTISPTRNQPV